MEGHRAGCSPGAHRPPAPGRGRHRARSMGRRSAMGSRVRHSRRGPPRGWLVRPRRSVSGQVSDGPATRLGAPGHDEVDARAPVDPRSGGRQGAHHQARRDPAIGSKLSLAHAQSGGMECVTGGRLGEPGHVRHRDPGRCRADRRGRCRGRGTCEAGYRRRRGPGRDDVVDLGSRDDHGASCRRRPDAPCQPGLACSPVPIRSPGCRPASTSDAIASGSDMPDTSGTAMALGCSVGVTVALGVGTGGPAEIT